MLDQLIPDFLVRDSSKGVFMQNLLELKKSDDLLLQIPELARDLAYLAILQEIEITEVITIWWDEILSKDTENSKLFCDKWNLKQILNETGEVVERTIDAPTFGMLKAYGYIEEISKGESNLTETFYSIWRDKPKRITQKSFELLENPVLPPKIFISYRRLESSAFALFIEARLSLADANIGIFIDKQIRVGDGWHGTLESAIKSSEIFIILIGTTSLDSPWVQQEIKWAQEANCRIIPIWHNGANPTTNMVAGLKHPNETQGITVKEESALDYELAMVQLLNGLGYRTY